MDKLIFLYDKLMTKKEQKLTGLNLKFVAYAQVKAKAYWVNDNKRKRIFLIPSKGVSTKLMYGAIFLLKNYEENKYKLHAYYNNSFAYLNMTIKEDLYDFSNVIISPIKFNSLKNIELCNYTYGNPIECVCFIGNEKNNKIQNSIKRRRYYKENNVDQKNFIQLIRDNKSKETEVS